MKFLKETTCIMSVSKLYEAIENDKTDLALSAIQKVRENINDIFDGHTCLHRACIIGNYEITMALLEAGASTNVTAYHSQAPIHDTAHHGHCDCMSLLTTHGCDVNIQNSRYDTPLHITSREGHTTCTKILLVAKCKVDVYNKDGFTALHLAARHNRPETVKMLVKYGADVTLKVCETKKTDKDHVNKTALELAKQEGNQAVADYLETVVGNDEGTPVSECVWFITQKNLFQ